MREILKELIQTIKTFFGWCRNPWSGGSMTRPFSREFTTVWESVAYTIIHRIGSGVYSFIYALVFEAGAIIAQAIVGLFSDLWHSDYKYARHAGAAIMAGLSAALSGILSVLSYIWKILWGER